MFIANSQFAFYYSNTIVRQNGNYSTFGYTIEEKVEITKRHLIKKQMEETGLAKRNAYKLGNKRNFT